MRKKKYHIDERGSEGYIRLGNAIIEKAVDDYRKCLARIKHYPFDGKANDEVQRIELFFHSSLYSAITSLYLDMVVKTIREEYGL